MPTALKFSHTDAFSYSKAGVDTIFNGEDTNSPYFQEYVLIHQLLGELGYAPKLHHIFLRPQANQLARDIKSRGLPVEPDLPFIAIDMDYLPSPWNLARMGNTPPTEIKNWSEATVIRLVNRMKEMQHNLTGLNIRCRDAQLFIYDEPGKGPEVILADLDRFGFGTPSQPASNDFTPQIKSLINSWEAASGKRLSLLGAN